MRFQVSVIENSPGPRPTIDITIKFEIRPKFEVTLYGDKELGNIGQGNDLMPGGTKLLPEPMLNHH